MIKKESHSGYPADRMTNACVIVGLDATIMYIFNEFSIGTYCSNHAFIDTYLQKGEYMITTYRFPNDYERETC